MRKTIKITCGALALTFALGFAGCSCVMEDAGAIKLTVWVSEADKKFAEDVAKAFKEKNPDKNYQIVIDIQGENDVATRVLKDVENAADVYSYVNDQVPKLINGDALARIAGDRLNRVTQANSAESMQSVTIENNGEKAVYGMPYTDNTFFLYYNKAALTETEVQTLDGILAKCSENKQFAFPMADGWYTTSFYFGKGLGYNVTYDKDLAETKIECDFDNEVGQRVTEAMWGYVQNKGFKADANDSKITAGFGDGSIIAAVSGIWNRTAIEGALKENFAAVKLPTYTLGGSQTGEQAGQRAGEQVQLVSFAGYKAMGVNNYSKHKTDALDFAEFYTNKENQIKHYEVRGFVPTDTQARQDEKIQTDICAKAITEQLKYSKTQLNVPSTLWVPMEGLGSAMITGAQSGSFDLQAQLKACVEAIKKTATKNTDSGNM